MAVVLDESDGSSKCHVGFYMSGPEDGEIMVDFLESSMTTWRRPSSDEILTVCLFLKSYPFKSMVTGKLLPGATKTQPQWFIMIAIPLKLSWKRWNWRRTSISNFKGGRKFSWVVLIVVFFIIYLSHLHIFYVFMWWTMHYLSILTNISMKTVLKTHFRY